MEIRACEPGDWARLRDIRLRALGGAPEAYASSLEREEAFPESTWRERATPTTQSTSFAAIDGDDWVGLAGVVRDDELQDSAQLVSMWIDPPQRGSGIGAEMVNAVVEWCRAHEIRRLRLWVSEPNAPAIALYERCGFAANGRRQPLPSNPGVTEFAMERLVDDES
jgi:RimJ/RimL family protein N-acetyltransferase